ncbi:MAG: pyridoxal phosphate-dependent aminotransferase [Candidatus Pacebacteria bacterium]|nr:pyridoxal phosphate-dependent aminotransferase [Candidatus Paceibacterota bacterium]
MKKPKIDSPIFFVGVRDNGIISFGSGQPDLPPPRQIFNILPDYRSFKYGLTQGQINLREALAKQYPGAKAENFVITNGASEALDLTIRALSQKFHGGKIMLFRPYYYSYPFLAKISGMTPVISDLKEGRIDLEDFKKKIKGCKAILINSPSNPTGKIESIETLKEIEKITQKLGIYILSDEVYKDLIYERENYLLHGPYVVTINSFSKTYAMCGFRVGYLYARDKELVRAVVEIKARTSMNTGILSQEMAFEATKVPRRQVDSQIKIWRQRRDLIYKGLKDMGFDLWKPEGAFYVFPKIKNANRVVNDLFYKHKVITYDGAWFGNPDRIRLSYALDVKDIKEGLRRIKKYIKGKESWLK